MPRSARLAARYALASALAFGLAACGSDSPAGKAGADAPVAATAAKIEVTSTAVAGERIQARYTCEGQDVSPPLEWGAVPADVRRLALFLVGFRRKHGTNQYAGTVEWALAGVSPSLHRLAAGQLPPGAYLGRARSDRQRYSLCPAKGTSVHYQFEVYGVPSSLTIPHRFSGISLLRSLTTASGPTRALAHGGFVALYTRP